MNEQSYAIIAGEIYTEDSVVTGQAVVVENGVIAGLVSQDEARRMATVYDYSAQRLLPGCIDTHIHGANGYDTMAATPAALDAISQYLARVGTTSFLATTVTEAFPAIAAAVRNIAACRETVSGARLLGAYIEGPYFTPEHRGAHPEHLLAEIDAAAMQQLIGEAPGVIKTVAVAPEKAGALELIAALTAQGIHCALGHTNADFATVRQAATAGADIAVHTYNGMRGLHHREPGMLGAALTLDTVCAELIADGIHVHPAAIEVLRRCKPSGKIVLISDAIQATGLPDGRYQLGQAEVTVQAGVARTASGSLAGSTTHLLRSVQYLMETVGVDPVEAVKMASLYPSRLLGLERELGSICAGKQADLVVVNQDFSPLLTLVAGQIVYQQ